MTSIALSNLIMSVAQLIHYVLQIYMYIIIARALLSWVNPDPYNPIVRFLYNITEPVLINVRRYVPIVAGGLDLSPLIVIAAIYFIDSFFLSTLIEWAYRIKQY